MKHILTLIAITATLALGACTCSKPADGKCCAKGEKAAKTDACCKAAGTDACCKAKAAAKKM